MSIIIYSSPTCAPCLTLKTYFRRKHLDFVVKDADSPEIHKELVELAGGRLLPTTVIEKDGVSHIIRGLNIPQINKVLEDD